jgi:transposase InsO family protein
MTEMVTSGSMSGERKRVMGFSARAATKDVARDWRRRPCTPSRRSSTLQRLIGTIRRECLDFVIPLTERHLRAILRDWISHYNRGRPHSSLGPGLPDPPPDRVVASTGHKLPGDHRVVVTPILGGLHHEYRLEAAA